MNKGTVIKTTIASAVLATSLFAGVSTYASNQKSSQQQVTHVTKQKESFTIIRSKWNKSYYGATVKASYPQLKDIKNVKVESKINELFLKNAKLLHEQAKKDSKGLKKAEKVKNTYTSDYKVKHNKNDILSVAFTNYSYTGGAHGMTDQIAYTINMKTGKQLTLKDAAKGDSNYKEIINKVIKKQIKERKIDLIEPFKSISKNQKFYLQGDQIVVYFDLYEYTPYAAGIPEFKIPLTAFTKPNK
ncbi:DUF3298 and DUF4163 domain-containing protein [Heyndrickxia sp. NPDC080065]|uniref:DUF3298 and DUF4163 domain-containing protein n=1 Tax=Heyndrickxia sp. NPDC080065 TaxID=3390568 RepID=UPI003D0699CE